MYSESDLDAAVTAGAITADAASGLRHHVATARAALTVDEESFRLLTGFNDIFVAIAIVLLLVAVGWIGQTIADPLGALLIAIGAWLLAEYFTRIRRMALPSIVLLIAFVGGVAGTLAGALFAPDAFGDWLDRISTGRKVQAAIVGLIAAAVAAITATAAWMHWRRFRVPITVAAGAVAVVGVVLSLVFGLIPAARYAAYPLILVAGLAMFAFAMH